MTTRLLAVCLLALAACTVRAQDFLDGASRFSSSKEAYLTLQNGEEMVGFVDKIKRKKGLIESISIKNAEGKVTTLKAEQVKHMYLAPSGWDQLVTAERKLSNVTKWEQDKSAHAQYIKDGYVFFETKEVILKKKKVTMLLQLVNPGFASRIKVYSNPMASETGGIGVGGLQLTGGDKKSYYISKDGAVAELLNKKSYSKAFDKLYSGCPAFKKEFAKSKSWSNVEKHVFFYSENCE